MRTLNGYQPDSRSLSGVQTLTDGTITIENGNISGVNQLYSKNFLTDSFTSNSLVAGQIDCSGSAIIASNFTAYGDCAIGVNDENILTVNSYIENTQIQWLESSTRKITYDAPEETTSITGSVNLNNFLKIDNKQEIVDVTYPCYMVEQHVTGLSFLVNVKAHDISCNRLTVPYLRSLDVSANTLTAPYIKSSDISANTLTAPYIKSSDVSCNTLTVPYIKSSDVSCNTLTAPYIKSSDISANTLTTFYITSSDISANTLTAPYIKCRDISANTLTAPYIKSSDISGNTLTAPYIKSSDISGNTLTAPYIKTSDISANTLTALYIKSSDISANTLTAPYIKSSDVSANTLTAPYIKSSDISGNTLTAPYIKSSDVSANTLTAPYIKSSDISGNTITILNNGTFGGSVGIGGPPDSYGLHCLYLANDSGDPYVTLRVDAAANGLYLIARSATGATNDARIVFRTGLAGAGESDALILNGDKSLLHGAIYTKPNYKGVTAKTNCNTIGTEEADSTILDGTYTGDTTQFAFTTSSSTVGYPYFGFGSTSSSGWFTSGGYSATTGTSTSGSFTDYVGTVWNGHWLQVQLKTFTIQPSTITVTMPKLTGNAASKTVNIFGYVSLGSWVYIGTITNPSNATYTATLTCAGKNYAQEFYRFLFSVQDCYVPGGGVVPNACLKNITIDGYFRTIVHGLYVPETMEVGRPNVLNNTIPSQYSLHVNGDAYFDRHCFRKSYCFEVDGDGTTAVPANTTITQYCTLTVRNNDFGMFGRSGWEGLKAPRSGMYQINFSCRFDDGNTLRAVVPRIVGVRDMGSFFVPTDGIDSYRRCFTYSTCVYLSQGQVFNLRTGYACNLQYWYFNGYYVTDTY